MKPLATLFAKATLATLTAFPLRLPAQSAFDGFNAIANDAVDAIAVQGDGKILLGGAFTQITFQNHASLARLTVDGRADPAFSGSADGDVQAIVEQGNGQILLGGCFTHVDGTLRNRMARVNADGTLDANFDPNANGCISAIALQNDGKILVGGAFTFIAGHAHSHAARLNPDGTLDTAFVAGASSTVESIALQADGKILLGGNFLTVDGTSHVGLARLLADGSLDAAFAAATNSNVFALALQADGKIIVGGQFTQIANQPAHYLARLNANGSLDATFRDLNINGIVDAIARQPDGALVIGGDFTQVDGSTRNHVARITRETTVDPALDPDALESGSTAGVNALALQSDGKLLIGGVFDRIGNQQHLNVARFYPGGSLDADLSNDTNPNTGIDNLSNHYAYVSALTLLADDKVVVGGNFNLLNGQTRHEVGLLDADGVTDAGFPDPQIPYAGTYTITSFAQPSPTNPQSPTVVAGSFGQYAGYVFNSMVEVGENGAPVSTFQPNVQYFSGGTHSAGTVYAIGVQPDGQIVIGGYFNQVYGKTRYGLARLTQGGVLDYNFDPLGSYDSGSSVAALAVQADGKLLVSVYDYGHDVFVLPRFDSDGNIDAGFAASLPAPYATALALDPAGRILVACELPGTTSRNHYLVRLNPDGSTDANFQPPALPVGDTTNGFGGAVQSIALQADGKIIVGGSFTEIGGVTRHSLARLNVNGTVDTSYADPNADADIKAMLLQPDGKLVVGGSFSTPAQGIARLATAQAALQSLQIATDGSIIAWERFGASPQLLWPPTLTWSTDGVNEQPIGTMTQFFESWIYTGWSPPQGMLVYVHAHGMSADGSGHSTGYPVDSVREFHMTPDGIFANGFE